MGLLDADIAALFRASFSGLLLDGTLHAGTSEPIYEHGIIVGFEGNDASIKVQTDQTSDELKASDGYAVGDARLIILSHGVTAISTSHEVTDGYGDRYRIMDVDQDAARSHWICRGRKA